MNRIPDITTPELTEVPEYRLAATCNGVPVYTVECNEYDVVRVTFFFRAGTSLQRVPFAASATANMLSEGTAGDEPLTSQQIAERLDYYGSYFDVNIDRDYVYVNFCMLSRFLAPTLDVAADILLHPSFPDEELRTYVAKRRQRLAIERMRVDTLAREELARCLFGSEHPYGRISPAEAYDTLTRGDLAEHYRRCYTAERCMVVCSGRIDGGVVEAVGRIAAQLPHGKPDEPVFPQPVTTHESFIERTEAVQSSLRVARRLFPRTHPDFVGMQVVAMALGGYMGSRLMQNLRERNGFTYGAVAAMVNFEREGYFAVSTQVDAAVTQQAVGEILAEIERLRREPMSADELQMVRNMMLGEMMRILDGPFGLADVAIENILCGNPNAVLLRNMHEIRTITPERICELAGRWLDRDRLVTVVAGRM